MSTAPPPSPKRNERINVQLTAEEKRAIEARAAAEGLAASVYLRRLGLGVGRG